MSDLRPDWKAITAAEKIDAVRPLVSQGLSSSQIAAQFQNVSRSSVIGLCHRTGMRLGGKKIGLRAHDRPKVEAKPTKPHRSKGQPKVNATVARAKAQRGLTKESSHHEAMSALTEAHLVTRQDYSLRHHCSYGFGDPKTDAFRFCGKRLHAGTHWCADHYAIVYSGGQG